MYSSRAFIWVVTPLGFYLVNLSICLRSFNCPPTEAHGSKEKWLKRTFRRCLKASGDGMAWVILYIIIYYNKIKCQSVKVSEFQNDASLSPKEALRLKVSGSKRHKKLDTPCWLGELLWNFACSENFASGSGLDPSSFHWKGVLFSFKIQIWTYKHLNYSPNEIVADRKATTTKNFIALEWHNLQVKCRLMQMASQYTTCCSADKQSFSRKGSHGNVK